MAGSLIANIIGWYGPLINLSDAESHIDDYVQLLLFVRSSHSQQLQKSNASKDSARFKVNVIVGDDTMSSFPVSIWQRHMESMIVVGDIILLQNVKIVKFRNVLEATTIHISSLLVLLHSYELGFCKGIDELLAQVQVGETAKAKLKKVLMWVQRTESIFQIVRRGNSCQVKGKVIKNWKEDEDAIPKCCLSVSEISRIKNTCHVKFEARIIDILALPLSHGKFGIEQMLVSNKLVATVVINDMVENLITEGCILCGLPVASRKSTAGTNLPLYCKNGANYHHNIGQIYNPFLLYVWDRCGQIPLLVKNKAAEMLFANIGAENVYKCYHEEKNRRQHQSTLKPNFYRIWLIIVKSLLEEDKNSPFRFEIVVDDEKNVENGRFELVSFRMPCYEKIGNTDPRLKAHQ